jgi:hypothetical protein
MNSSATNSVQVKVYELYYMKTPENEATARATLQKSIKTLKRKVRIYVASASATSLLDQRRLVHLYPRVQHLPEMRNDGFIDVAFVWVDLCECHVEGLCKRNVKSDLKKELVKKWIHTLSSVTFQSLIFVFGGSFDHET